MNPNLIRRHMKDKCIRNKNLKSNKSRRIFLISFNLHLIYCEVIKFICVVGNNILLANHMLSEGLKMSWAILVDKYRLVVVAQQLRRIFFLLMLFLNASYFFVSKFNCFYRLRIHSAVYHPFESDFKIVQPMMIS